MSDPGRGERTSGSLAPHPRVIETDKEWPENVSDVDYRNHIFQRVVANKKRFQDIDFRYCTFDGCYLRKCSFEACDFTGARFLGTSLLGSTFSSCKFDYVTFERTIVEDEILFTCAPQHENIRQRFARSLRANYESMGETESVNKAILIELSATRDHLRNAWSSRERYYRSKYAGWERVKAFFSWLQFVSLDAIWGHGERADRLVRASVVVVLLLAAGDTVLSRRPMVLGDWAAALGDAVQSFLGTSQPVYPLGIIVLVALVRYVLLGLFVSVLFRRFARR